MAEWRTQIHVNYNQTYHSYGYSFLYQLEQNQLNLASWLENGFADMSNNYVPTQSCFYAPGTPEQSPPHSPETHAYSGGGGLGQYQSTGLMYLGDTEAEQLLLLPEQPLENAGVRAASDSISDCDPQTSPDSWSSGSNGEGVLPQVDPATWSHKTNLDDETASTSPDSTEDIPIVQDDSQTYCLLANESNSNNMTTSENASVTSPKTQSTKGKVRAAFSEMQMNILTQRFNVQRYLTPAEMKNMAEITGLTYKQVKTWFQNRRMKLRRHQKDNSWASERYTVNKDGAGHGAAFANLPPHVQPYQGQGPGLQEHYNPQMFEAALKTAAPQNLALYLASVGGANGVAGYPNWPTNAVHNRPQAAGWPMPSDTPQFSYGAAFNPQNFSNAHDAGFKEDEQVNIVQSCTQ